MYDENKIAAIVICKPDTDKLSAYRGTIDLENEAIGLQGHFDFDVENCPIDTKVTIKQNQVEIAIFETDQDNVSNADSLESQAAKEILLQSALEGVQGSFEMTEFFTEPGAVRAVGSDVTDQEAGWQIASMIEHKNEFQINLDVLIGVDRQKLVELLNGVRAFD